MPAWPLPGPVPFIDSNSSSPSSLTRAHFLVALAREGKGRDVLLIWNAYSRRNIYKHKTNELIEHAAVRAATGLFWQRSSSAAAVSRGMG